MQNDNNLIEINKFAQASGVTKATLMHYEKIGLFKPEYVAENGYRYYGYNQIYKIEIITTLRRLDMSLTEIKEFLDNDSKQSKLKVLESKQEFIANELFRLEQISRLLNITVNNIREESYIIFNEPFIERLNNPTFLFLFRTPYRDGSITPELTETRKLLQKYRHLYMDTSFNVGEVVLHKNVMNGSYTKEFGCYQLTEKIDDPACYEKPEGLYISMYYRGNSNEIPKAYGLLKKYCAKHNFEIIGNAYEEDYSTVISEVDLNRFILKVSFQISESL